MLRVRVVTILAASALMCSLCASSQQSKSNGATKVRAERVDLAQSVFQKAASSIVFLVTKKGTETYARGSGIVLTQDGFIATNYHVLQGADSVEVRIFHKPDKNDESLTIGNARLFYADETRDIAVLRITTDPLPHLECTNTITSPVVGERVYAIGNPRGLSNTISDGIVSALRTLHDREVIQHTAPISPGSSGGALLNASGALIGMNTSTLTDSQNLNFAIPRKYIAAALVAAKTNKSEIPFPPEKVGDDSAGFKDRAWRALASGDYVQAVNQCEQAITAGLSTPDIYTILGVAKYELGRKDEAAQYLRQSLRMEKSDEVFKQTARLYMLRILGDAFQNQPETVSRSELLQLANDFLASPTGSLFRDEAHDQRMRTWAASVSKQVRSIAGTWADAAKDQSLAHVFVNNEYVISEGTDGGFVVTLFHRDGASPLVLRMYGQVAESREGGFSGKIERYLILSDGTAGGVARQQMTVTFRLSEDMARIEGTVIYGEIETDGRRTLRDFTAQLFGSDRGQRTFALRRKQ